MFLKNHKQRDWALQFKPVITKRKWRSGKAVRTVEHHQNKKRKKNYKTEFGDKWAAKDIQFVINRTKTKLISHDWKRKKPCQEENRNWKKFSFTFFRIFLGPKTIHPPETCPSFLPFTSNTQQSTPTRMHCICSSQYTKSTKVRGTGTIEKQKESF